MMQTTAGSGVQLQLVAYSVCLHCLRPQAGSGKSQGKELVL